MERSCVLGVHSNQSRGNVRKHYGLKPWHHEKKFRGANGEVDWSSEENANKLARHIREYWLEKGHVVDVWVEKVIGAQARYGTKPTYQINSNIQLDTSRFGIAKREGETNKTTTSAIKSDEPSHWAYRP